MTTGIVMATSGGPHSAEKWADVSARMICPVDPDLSPERLVQARRLQNLIFEALIGRHSAAQLYERQALSDKGDPHLTSEIDPSFPAQEALVSIQAAAKGTLWEAHFQQADVCREVVQLIGNHMATIRHIERQWYCKRNPSDKTTAWLADHHRGVA